jgi:hypothetical protein
VTPSAPTPRPRQTCAAACWGTRLPLWPSRPLHPRLLPLRSRWPCLMAALRRNGRRLLLALVGGGVVGGGPLLLGLGEGAREGGRMVVESEGHGARCRGWRGCARASSNTLGADALTAC